MTILRSSSPPGIAGTHLMNLTGKKTGASTYHGPLTHAMCSRLLLPLYLITQERLLLMILLTRITLSLKYSKKVGKGRGRGKKMDKEGAAVRRVPGVQPVKIVTPQPPPLSTSWYSRSTIPKVPESCLLYAGTTRLLSPATLQVQEPSPPPTNM